MWSASGEVEVRTTQGHYSADNAVIAVPLGVLQGHLTFTPALPDFKRTALAGLRMGPVIKLIYKFSEPIVPKEVMALYSRLNPPMWWSPSFGHDTDENMSGPRLSLATERRSYSRWGKRGRWVPR